MKKETLIVIPAHNEESRIGEIICKIRNVSTDADFDILIIDDGSFDKTRDEAISNGVEVVSLPFNLGYGATLETGYTYAYIKGYRYLVQMDADGQHEPKCIVDLLDAIKKDKADLVIGSRYLKDCGYKSTFARHVGTVIFSKIATFLSKKKITDPTSGFQAMNRRVLEFFVKGFYPSDYPDADVLILLNRSGFRIAEIPVIMYSKSDRKSMHAGVIGPVYYIFKMLLSIFMIYLRKKPDLSDI